MKFYLIITAMCLTLAGGYHFSDVAQRVYSPDRPYLAPDPQFVGSLHHLQLSRND